jgi:hypothetical protein
VKFSCSHAAFTFSFLTLYQYGNLRGPSTEELGSNVMGHGKESSGSKTAHPGIPRRSSNPSCRNEKRRRFFSCSHRRVDEEPQSQLTHRQRLSRLVPLGCGESPRRLAATCPRPRAVDPRLQARRARTLSGTGGRVCSLSCSSSPDGRGRSSLQCPAARLLVFQGRVRKGAGSRRYERPCRWTCSLAAKPRLLIDTVMRLRRMAR